MKRRCIALALGATLLAGPGCRNYYTPFSRTTYSSIVPPLGPGAHLHHKAPPQEMLMNPGPGVGGPGPGVLIPEPLAPAQAQVSQVVFASPDGMTVNWDVSAQGAFDSEPLIVPGRYNFTQVAIYRLKLSNIPNRPGVELYPTLEVGPATPRTEAFLTHNAIPAQFTEEDFDQVQSGNFVTKVIYLPDAEFQELALAGVETLVSTRLDPGLDPIVEADRRGTILAIIRVGNMDLEVPQPAGVAGGAPMAFGGGAPMGISGVPRGFISGVTIPPYGAPITGTPIGMPGPPHIPLGMPAGLQRHTVANHTLSHIPGPAKAIKYNVTQHPGYVGPRPDTHIRVRPCGQDGQCEVVEGNCPPQAPPQGQ